ADRGGTASSRAIKERGRKNRKLKLEEEENLDEFLAVSGNTG
ncbi:hypothetical protein A2U01_0097477, partial [Trifolium medium]|nr:hypothetical protein [Trifolium medium]